MRTSFKGSRNNQAIHFTPYLTTLLGVWTHRASGLNGATFSPEGHYGKSCRHMRLGPSTLAEDRLDVERKINTMTVQSGDSLVD